MDLAAKEGKPQRIAPLADKAVELAEVFLQEDFVVWSIRLNQACLTQDKALGLAAVKGLLAAIERPGKNRGELYPHLPHQPQKDPGEILARLKAGVLRELRDPEETGYGFLRGEELEEMLEGEG